jgi:uncharacterized protein YfbU (UPF0304 family)
MELTRAERWILCNQYEILKRLSDDDTPLYDQIITILSRGYVDEYDYAAQYVGESTLPHDIAEETKEILYMFEQMQWVREKAELTDHRHIALFTFWGFDGNNNHEHLSYADFLLRRGDFPYLKLTHCPNSHLNTIATYRVMLEMWNSLGRKGLQMDEQEILAILDSPELARLPIPVFEVAEDELSETDTEE